MLDREFCCDEGGGKKSKLSTKSSEVLGVVQLMYYAPYLCKQCIVFVISMLYFGVTLENEIHLWSCNV